LPVPAAQRLLAAAVSLRLVVRRRGGRYGLGPLGAPLVGNTAIAAMVQHHAALYADLADPLALLRGQAGASAVARYWPYAGADAPQRLDPARVATYSDLMAASQPLVAEQVLQAYPLARHRVLLDVGGGDGSFAAAAARRCPRLRVMLFDLPGVAERARQRFAADGLAQRASAHGGSFFADPLPPGADVVSLVRVIHDHDDAAAMQILRAVRLALAPGGVLLLAEPLSGTPGAEPMGDAYFGFYLLAMGQGRPRTAAELAAMLQQAGFAAVRTLQTNLPLQTGLMVASAGSA
jgi:demethylspheroidene O-methyltransferase